MGFKLAVVIILLLCVLCVVQGKKATKKTPSKPPAVIIKSDVEITGVSDQQLTIRPGSKPIVTPVVPVIVPPAYTITLQDIGDCCDNHKLTILFEYAAKEMHADGTAATHNIEFRREHLADTKLSGFPRIIKTRRNGDVLEYTGATDYAPLADWIINESILA